MIAFAVSFKQATQLKLNLAGSWELVSYKNQQDNSTEWIDPDVNITYQKHVTNTHFTWMQYDEGKNLLVGLGGGTYIISKEGKYIENINFFYPAGSSELGQSIPFTVKFVGDKWYHTGEVKQMEIDENGELTVSGTTKIEEIWQPINTDYQNNKTLLGTWILSSYRNDPNNPYQEYPEFTGYMKLVTNSHFIWIKYDKEGDQIYAVGGGSYRFNSNKYTEQISMWYPASSDVPGASVTFSPVINAHKWIHKGTLVTDENSYPIDEIWIPYSASIEDETAFNN
jgi:hypothetical protein